MTADPWDPAVYERFEAERRQPFDDLLALCERGPSTVVDLGCGSGKLTADLHRVLGASRTVGVDRSVSMLGEAPADVPGLTFEVGTIEDWDGGEVDLIFANASLHWVEDHPTLLARLHRHLVPGGQLAFQVPANFHHASHRIARELAGDESIVPVLTPGEYAGLLHDLGARTQRVRLEIYAHELASVDAVVEWCKGTLLTRYRDLGDEFVERFRTRLLEELGDQRPYLYLFPRILAWAHF